MPETPPLAQCCICRATTRLPEDDRAPLPHGWRYRSLTVDAGRYYCPRHARKAG